MHGIKKNYVMSLAKTKQNNKIKKSKVGQEIPHFLIFRPRHQSIGHICTHVLGNQRTSPYTLDFPSKICRPQSLKLDPKSSTPKAV